MSMELRTDEVPCITLISRNDPRLEKVHSDMAGSSWAPYIAHLLEKCCLSTLEHTPPPKCTWGSLKKHNFFHGFKKLEQCYCLIMYRPLLLENVKQIANVVIFKT